MDTCAFIVVTFCCRRTPHVSLFISRVNLSTSCWEQSRNTNNRASLDKRNCRCLHKYQSMGNLIRQNRSGFTTPKIWPLPPEATTRWRYFEKGFDKRIFKVKYKRKLNTSRVGG